MSKQPKILITTAAFGDGHNTAARNLHAAFQRLGVDSEVRDFLVEGAPGVTRTLNQSYRWAITHMPRLWHRLYGYADKACLHGSWLNAFDLPERALASYLGRHRPDFILSTYPLYAYLLNSLYLGRLRRPFPVYNVITDSLTINHAWLRGGVDHSFVTDALTADIVRQDLPPHDVTVSGFPVDLGFERLFSQLTPPRPGYPLRVLYMATERPPKVAQTLRHILEYQSRSGMDVTVVLGRREKELRRLVESVAGRQSVEILGWTDRIPELMCTHHVLISKAGGATVHEARAAHCPLMINFVVPGQEEGNAELMLRENCGCRLENTQDIPRQLRAWFEHGAERWLALRDSLYRVGQPDAAMNIARRTLAMNGLSAPEISQFPEPPLEEKASSSKA
ncbi:MAG: galactosyldiacylglycerol synthase [Verrucomicrobiota bacterium]